MANTAENEAARLEEIAGEISRIAPVVRSAIDRVFANEISLEQAESINRSAEVLLGLYELEADIRRRSQVATRTSGKGVPGGRR